MHLISFLIALVLVQTLLLAYLLFRWQPRPREPRMKKPFVPSVPKGYKRPAPCPVPPRSFSQGGAR
jgi:hypothetical protein